MRDFWNWMQQNLFIHDIIFENQHFLAEAELYSRLERVSVAEHLHLMNESVSEQNIYAAVTKACGTHKLERNATMFHVNIIDQAVWSEEEYKFYPFPLPRSEKPLAQLFRRMEQFPAEQGGTTYVGLLGEGKKWLLLIERNGSPPQKGEADFLIRVFGSDSFCKAARSFLKQRVE